MIQKTSARVLVVDDSLAVAKRLKGSLENAGYQVETARNGRDALQLAFRRPFDLIITDEQMPVMSGRELCRRLRDDERYADTPIVFLTGGEFGSSEGDQALRVTEGFGKPFNPHSLLRVVEKELSGARAAMRKKEALQSRARR